MIEVKVIEVKDEKSGRFSKRVFDKDPMDWFKENNRKRWGISLPYKSPRSSMKKLGVKVTIDTG